MGYYVFVFAMLYLVGVFVFLEVIVFLVAIVMRIFLSLYFEK